MRGLKEPTAFILTWNPDLHPLDFASDGQILARGSRIPGRWAVGQRRNGMQRGDSLWLFRLGKAASNPGIVRRAQVTGQVFEAPHWSSARAAAGVKANYISLDWCEQSPESQPLSRDTLIESVPEAPWAHLQSSGVGLGLHSAQALRELWDHHLRTVPQTTRPQHVVTPPCEQPKNDATNASDHADESSGGRARIDQVILAKLEADPRSTFADIAPVVRAAGITSDVTLALYRLARKGDVLRHGGSPTRWELASGAVDVGIAPDGSNPQEVVEVYLRASADTWSPAQLASALQGPNVLRMTAFSATELQESIDIVLREKMGRDLWSSWYEVASTFRARSIRL